MPRRVPSHAELKKNQKLNFGSKIKSSKVNRRYVFEIFKKNAANEKLRIFGENFGEKFWNFYAIFFMKIQQKTKQSKFQSTK